LLCADVYDTADHYFSIAEAGGEAELVGTVILPADHYSTVAKAGDKAELAGKAIL